MAENKKLDTDGSAIVDLREKVTLYAPKGAAFHSEGEETQVAATQKEHFLKLGYTETKPSAKK